MKSGILISMGIVIAIATAFLLFSNGHKSPEVNCYYTIGEGGIGNPVNVMAAAQDGNATAQGSLGLYYMGNRGNPPVNSDEADYVQAFGWLLRAAKQGDAYAQFRLAQLYLEGYGVDRNPQEAYFWMLLAEPHLRKNRNGQFEPSCEAKDTLARSKAELPANEIETVEKRAKEWRPVLERRE